MAAQTVNPVDLSDVVDEISDLQHIADEKREELTEINQKLKMALEKMQKFVDVKKSEIDGWQNNSVVSDNNSANFHKQIKNEKWDNSNKPKPVPSYKKSATSDQPKHNMSLLAAVWDVLDRDQDTYNSVVDATTKKLVIQEKISDFIGLKVSEIKDIILAEKKWTSDSTSIAQQIQQAIYKLKYEGKISRGDNRRYFIVDGAEFDGPPLNEDGSPMVEQTDGTFHTSEGKVFTNADGKEYRRRSRKSSS